MIICIVSNLYILTMKSENYARNKAMDVCEIKKCHYQPTPQ